MEKLLKANEEKPYLLGDEVSKYVFHLVSLTMIYLYEEEEKN